MVTTSGFPKSGNHGVAKAVQLLGVACQVEHLPFKSGLKGKHVFIRRDPRNIICSWLRFKGTPVTPESFISAFRMFQHDSFPKELGKYQGWLKHKGTLVISFEALIADDAEIRRIADYLEVPYVAGAFEALPGLTRTWFAEHSDYTKIWTPEVEAMWAAEGGPELLARWGYK